MKNNSRIFAAIVYSLVFLSFLATPGAARRLKLYKWPKSIAAGQLGFLVFENPTPEISKSQSKCTADRYIAWVQSDIPILRIEQNGKQIFTSLGSYQTMGDSCIASFMVPVALEPGAATLYLLNGHDPSTPYTFTCTKDIDVHLDAIQGSGLEPLRQFRLIGSGFFPSVIVDPTNARNELEDNIGLSKKSKEEQYTLFNKRITTDWDRVPLGNFLTLTQGQKTWQLFVEQCGITDRGLALDFTAPPDIAKGTATLVLRLRQNKKEVEKSAPLTVTIL